MHKTKNMVFTMKFYKFCQVDTSDWITSLTTSIEY
jgi:hypothetical protein